MTTATTVQCEKNAIVETTPQFSPRFENPKLRSMKHLVREFRLHAGTVSAIVSDGFGRPVLLIHGNSSCKEIWVHQIEALRRQGRAVLALDLPGHGQSGNARKPDEIYNFPGYGSVVSDVLDILRWPFIDVVGWSLGGHIGLQLLATDARVRSLVIVGTPPSRLSREALKDAFYASTDMGLTGKREFSDSDALAYAASMLGGEGFVSRHLLDSVRRTDGDARYLMFNSALEGIGVDQKQLVEESGKRICVMHGQRDPFVRLDYLSSLKYKNLWKDRVYVFSGAGHAPHWQYPFEFNRVLGEFYSEESANQEIGACTDKATT